ncbi:hypothetical protein N9Y75_03000 [Candidatus Poseidoniales archaeon]|nr:hypothetical protein [Candidatus Poseidoniales archaeon]MDB2333485.1 hypothetical protein [Candidatus Poseidoniales archaeon]MDB2542128.1 hypothetical protein [Candidatus Poseidoniales archaeon]MDB2671797.1 hypothetical protein [Candidatus Poseidoniales archaeon]MDC3316657.1 hypothetical protein [Candidatus Poseidoniaceae archaeon]|tara:strand:- start:216 stop:860 length:645 start_codon:yes stop_codon:yes gene_type:complete
MEDELVVHEDDIISSKPLGLLESSQRQEAFAMGLDLDDPEQAEAYMQAQQAALFIKDTIRNINPSRVAIAGLIMLLLVGLIASGWYWVLPRDDVEVETIYMQRGGHLIMSELYNDGSRAITDVTVQVEFQDEFGTLIQEMRIDVDEVAAHSSLAGDDLEMIVLGYTVWDEYILEVSVTWTSFDNRVHTESWSHVVGEWASERFVDDCETTTKLF